MVLLAVEGGQLSRVEQGVAALHLALFVSIWWQHAAAACVRGRGLRKAEALVGPLIECRGDAVVARQVRPPTLRLRELSSSRGMYIARKTNACPRACLSRQWASRGLWFGAAGWLAGLCCAMVVGLAVGGELKRVLLESPS